MDATTAHPIFFISYNQADRLWAEWIAWTLEEAGYQAVIQSWDFRPGSNFVLEMQRATATAERVVIVLSNNYLQSEFTQPEWAVAMARDPQGNKRTLVPVRVQECSPVGLLAQVVWIDLIGLSAEAAREALLRGMGERGKPDRPPIFPGFATGQDVHHRAVPFPGAITLDIGRLPIPSRQFVGREKELARLDWAWEDSSIHVLTLVAFGGVGKSALVAYWIDRMAADGWRGASRVLDWSFYSQGLENRVTSADSFIDHALHSFGDPDPKAGSSYDRGTRLASLVRSQRTLLILDGIEPMQYPPGRVEIEGRIKDPGLAALLRGLAGANQGLCVITTRANIADLAGFQKTAPQIPLEELDPESAVKLLRQLGVYGREAELRSAVEDFRHHALTLTLLGNYLRRARGGYIRKRYEIDLSHADEKQGGHAFRVIAAYTRWLGDGAELAILRLLGFFDRPAEVAAMKVLRASPALPGLTDSLVKLSEDDWRITVANLRDLGLLALADPREPDILDTHPLVRAYFSEELENRMPGSWQEGNRRLYEHLCQMAPEYPETLESMQLLYAAVVHGCRAGLQQEAIEEIYKRRILRHNEHFSWKKLGAFGSELAALACFFDRPWSQASVRLSVANQALILSEVPFVLRALGRLSDGIEPLRESLEAAIASEDWEEAAIRANNLSEMTLTLGFVTQAVTWGRQSVELADRAGGFWTVASRTTWADALHQAGRWEESGAVFRKAESIQAERQPHYPKLYSFWGFHYCEFLLHQAEPESGAGLDGLYLQQEKVEHFRQAYQEVLERARQTLEWAENTGKASLLTIALEHLSVGRAHLGLALASQPELMTEGPAATLSQAAQHLNLAVNDLRQASTEHNLPFGLLARASLWRFHSNFAAVTADLTEALEITQRGSMRLHECDVHLEWARLCRDQGSLTAAQRHVARARELVAQTGYKRREREVAYLERLLSGTARIDETSSN